ncbi:MAG: hypothetical protein PVH45_02005 [Candidatus Omnitrophota bacterium]|jgi:hypothetical protein
MIIIHDRRLPAEYQRALKERFPSAILHPLSGSGEVYDSILCHPDIYFFRLNRTKVIHAPGVPEQDLFDLRELGVELIKGEGNPKGPYPGTIRYNVARIGKTVFHNLAHTDPVILRSAQKSGLELVNVAQGYARCSVLPAGKEALITADRTIAEAARGKGFDVLKISPGSVILPGEEYGFIGGAGGCMPDGSLIMLGDIDHHPEASRIKNFLIKHSVQYVDIAGLPLYDAGGLFIFS